MTWKDEALYLANEWEGEWLRGNIGHGIVEGGGGSYTVATMNPTEDEFFLSMMAWAGYSVGPHRTKTELERRREKFGKNRKKLYWMIAGRDGEFCQRCRSAKRLTVDHVIPIAAGGSDDLANLQILCHSCNSRKGAR